MLYHVSYDLHNPGRTYSPVVEAIKAVGAWAHIGGSVWVVDTLLPAKDVFDRIRASADSNDSFFIVRIQQDWWSVNLTAAVVEWLKDSSRRW